MTGNGSEPRGMEALLRDSEKRTVALERRRMSSRTVASLLPGRLHPTGEEVEDFDLAIESGTYATGAAPLNAPPGSGPFLISVQAKGDPFSTEFGVRQRAYSFTTGVEHTRQYEQWGVADGDWSAWVEEGSWDSITGKPTTFPPSAHGHNLTDANITGTLPVDHGGTGATTAANARVNLGAAATVHGHSLTDANITGTLPVGQGGTGATTPTNARTNLGAAAASHTHSADEITSGTFALARLPQSSDTLPGIARRATQAEVDGGTNAVAYVTPDTLRQSSMIPRRVMTGSVSSGSAAYANVTLSNFLSTPKIVASGGTQSSVGIPRVVNQSTSSFQVGVWSLAGSQIAFSNADWIAVEVRS